MVFLANLNPFRGEKRKLEGPAAYAENPKVEMKYKGADVLWRMMESPRDNGFFDKLNEQHPDIAKKLVDGIDEIKKSLTPQQRHDLIYDKTHDMAYGKSHREDEYFAWDRDTELYLSQIDSCEGADPIILERAVERLLEKIGRAAQELVDEDAKPKPAELAS